jgi:SAM-dependent methyltransferase
MPGSYSRSFFALQGETSSRSASVVVPIVVDLVGEVRSVIDVGCGSGEWLATFTQHGAEDAFGIDAQHVPRELLAIPTDAFMVHDLRIPLSVGREYDLAMSLEVVEHLPPESAARLVSDLVALAPIVLFSAAIPFQGGTEHLNEQWPDYWAELFAAHGFSPIDLIRDRIWADPAVDWWYAQNTLLYASEKALATRPRLAEAVVPDPRALARVHPANYLHRVDPEQMSLFWTLRRVGAVAPNFVKRRLRSNRAPLPPPGPRHQPHAEEARRQTPVQ